MGRRPRPVGRARRVEGDVPDTRIAADLGLVCRAGERAVTVATRPGGEAVAVLGSPSDPEAFTVWRADGVYVFFRGPAPARLELRFDTAAGVAAVVTYDEGSRSMETAAEHIDFEVDGVGFVLRVFPDPSGLRGQVFSGDEKVAGVQIYHREDREALLQAARTDRAVRRAVEARRATT
jgi:hypothetical protein